MNNNWPFNVSAGCRIRVHSVSVVAQRVSASVSANHPPDMTIFSCVWLEACACETIETQEGDFEMALKQCCLRQSG
jgi:hypothetical protein